MSNAPKKDYVLLDQSDEAAHNRVEEPETGEVISD